MPAALLFVVLPCWDFFFTPGAEKAIMSHIDQLYERSSNVQKILLIATGGTIASTKTAQGLAPGITSQELYESVPEAAAFCTIDTVQLLNIDSTNVQPEQWLLMAKTIEDHYDAYDGFVITHGTDTMAYTAAALSYLIQHANKPIVLTGSAIVSRIGKAFHLDHKSLMLLIGCGASGAVAGIFKAPIAGLVFTLEVLMLDLTMASLLPLLVSCLTATCVTYALTGTEAMFAFRMDEAFRVERIPSYILLGVFCGLISLYFTRTMNAFEQVFGRIGGLWPRLALGGGTLALLIFLFPPLYGEGYGTISTLLGGSNAESVMNNSFFYGHSDMLLPYLGLIILLKVFATTATNGGGGCGGTFAPSLFLGCIGGFAFSSVWKQFLPFGIHIPETNYALLGMAGVMSGVFHAPLTGVFLIAELTGGYDLFLPLMIVSAASYLTIHTFEPHSIYSMRLARKGELLTHHKDRSVLTLMSLDAVIERDRPRISPDMNLGQIVQVVSKVKAIHFAVTDIKGNLIGIINVNSLRKIIFRSELYRMYKAEQLMQKPTLILRTDDSMQSVMDKFQSVAAATLPVVNPEGHFEGFVSKTRLYSLYRQIIKDFSEE